MPRVSERLLRALLIETHCCGLDGFMVCESVSALRGMGTGTQVLSYACLVPQVSDSDSAGVLSCSLVFRFLVLATAVERDKGVLEELIMAATLNKNKLGQWPAAASHGLPRVVPSF
ncbi:hypothetical protein F503_03647 [Ophiostoma piceae UAMH 11346]|uniref:Uncharacterized protein n=1 Tax=Ophiostoma piceae (strain UAMH 11346) TaxID=1262450 RepID=S3CV12_OPHP1|nr:hypothetical protein F503_03647 [Ophiostoma piceae UAMH 11346]